MANDPNTSAPISHARDRSISAANAARASSARVTSSGSHQPSALTTRLSNAPSGDRLAITALTA